MKSCIKIAGAATLLLVGSLMTHSQLGFSAVTPIQICGCGSGDCSDCCATTKRRSGCRKCGAKRGCRQCPKCEMPCCSLDVEKIEESRSCFQVEQKVVCIPRVRFPWQECCPPKKSRTRTFNVLKKHSYKCPSCEYTWNVDELVVEPPFGPVYQQSSRPRAPITLEPATARVHHEPILKGPVAEPADPIAVTAPLVTKQD